MPRARSRAHGAGGRQDGAGVARRELTSVPAQAQPGKVPLSPKVRALLVFTCLLVLVDTVFFTALTPLLPHYTQVAHLSKSGAGILVAGYPLGTLAAYVLEPQAEDGLCTWNFFDDGLKEGTDFPIVRVPAAVPIPAIMKKPLAADRQ